MLSGPDGPPGCLLIIWKPTPVAEERHRESSANHMGWNEEKQSTTIKTNGNACTEQNQTVDRLVSD